MGSYIEIGTVILDGKHERIEVIGGGPVLRVAVDPMRTLSQTLKETSLSAICILANRDGGINGRGGRIRTGDPLLPKQVR